MEIPAPQTAPVICGVRAKRRYAPCLRCTTDFRLPHSTQCVQMKVGVEGACSKQAEWRYAPSRFTCACGAAKQKGRRTRPCQLSNKEPDFRADNHSETLRCMN